MSLPLLARLNQKVAIEKALQQGANVNEKDLWGHTSLFYSCRYNHMEIVQLLLQQHEIFVNCSGNDNNYSPFFASNGQTESILILLADGRVDVNWRNKLGETILAGACLRGYTKTVKLLLSSGRSVVVSERLLDIARMGNKHFIVSILKDYQDNPIQTQRLLRKQLNLKGNIKT